MEKLGSVTRNTLIDALVDLYDGGELKCYTGSQPATPDTAPTGTLFLTITLPTPAFGAGVAGVASKTGVWSGVAAADVDLTPTTGADEPGWFRIKTSGGTHPVDGLIGAVGSGAELELDVMVIANGQTVNIGAGTATMPAS